MSQTRKDTVTFDIGWVFLGVLALVIAFFTVQFGYIPRVREYAIFDANCRTGTGNSTRTGVPVFDVDGVRRCLSVSPPVIQLNFGVPPVAPAPSEPDGPTFVPNGTKVM